MIQHLIHSSILAVLFYGVYHFFLRKETFFQWNRAYLLAIPIISIGLPFISLPISSEVTQIFETNVRLLNPITIDSKQPMPDITDSSITLVHLLVIIYVLGVLISLTMAFFKFNEIRKLICSGERYKNGSSLIIATAKSGIACSFFNYIIIDKNIDHSDYYKIIEHEQIHVAQKHSSDLFFYELMRIFLWFHPTVYLAQNELKKIHEYIVDNELCQNHKVQEYQTDLIINALGCNHLSLSHPFYNSTILKNRIIMLQKSKSTQTSILKIAFILPLLVMSVLYTSCNQEENLEEESTQVEEIIEIEEIKNSELGFEFVNTDVPFAIIEEVPHFEDCTGTQTEIKKCTQEKITQFVNKNFNTGIAKDYKGKHKISVQFKIDKNGNVVGVQSKAKSIELQNEAARVINKLPKMIPGKQRGEEVGVIYALPIIFEVQE
jgi:bla regulator protein BlaR1